MILQVAYHADCLEYMRSQPDNLVDLTMTSPPYEDCRTYSIGFKLRGQDWVDWCIPRVVEMCRITNGLVIFNAAGKVKQFKYSPVIEWLVSDLTRNHGVVCGPAPYVFSRVGIPGSGSKHYHRRDWEPVYAFAKPESLPLAWSDNTCMGHAPKYGVGGEMSNRHKDGRRINAQLSPSRNQWGGSHAVGGCNKHGVRKNSGDRPSHRKSAQHQGYSKPVLANPGNVIHCKVGGGVMGNRLCHENEAPFPEAFAEFFVRSYCPPGGKVFDPFCGSGTVLAVAKMWGRNAIGCDIRQSQCDLVYRRLESTQVRLIQE